MPRGGPDPVGRSTACPSCLLTAKFCYITARYYRATDPWPCVSAFAPTPAHSTHTDVPRLPRVTMRSRTKRS